MCLSQFDGAILEIVFKYRLGHQLGQILTLLRCGWTILTLWTYKLRVVVRSCHLKHLNSIHLTEIACETPMKITMKSWLILKENSKLT